MLTLIEEKVSKDENKRVNEPMGCVIMEQWGRGHFFVGVYGMWRIFI